MELIQIVLHVLDCGFSMVGVLYHLVNIHSVLDAQWRFCQGNTLARQRVEKSHSGTGYSPVPECIHLLTSLMHQVVIWVVELSDARIWRHHCPEQVELGDPGMSDKKGQYPVYEMPKHNNFDGMDDIRYDDCCQWDAFHDPDDSVCSSNCSILQILLFFLSLGLISLICEYHLLKV